MYNKGLYGNIAEVLGPNPFLWLIPTTRGIGNGVAFFKRSVGSTASVTAGELHYGKVSTNLFMGLNPKEKKEEEEEEEEDPLLMKQQHVVVDRLAD